MVVHFILVESALELVPKALWKKPAVVNDSRRREKEPAQILLDRSFHHTSMTGLRDAERRGRPDLVHVALLAVTGTPAYLEGRVRAYVHTLDDRVLSFAEGTRIPKSYFRFRGLIEKVIFDGGDGLVTIKESTVADVLKKAHSDLVVGFSVQGKPWNPVEFRRAAASAKDPSLLVGGFPRGHFSPGTIDCVDELLRIDSRPLEAHVVVSRVIYELERAFQPT